MSAEDLRNGGSGEAVDESGAGRDEENEARHCGGRCEEEEKNSEAGVLKKVRDDCDPEQDAGCSEEREGTAEVGKGGGDARAVRDGVDHSVLCLIGSAAAVGVVIGAITLFPPEEGVLRIALTLAGYPAMVALFYVSYIRWGRWLGAPPRLLEASLGFAVASWLLLFSGDAGAQRLALWTGQTAVLLCGVSLGGGLAVVSARRSVGLAGAIRAVLGAKGEDRKWAEAREERL